MSRIIGCGIDIEELIRFKKHLPTGPEISGFCRMVYTGEEILRNSKILPHLTYPIGFSCKEAFFKALGVSWTNSGISWKDIELLFNDSEDLQDHSILLHGYALELFKSRNCGKIESSLEYTADYIIFQIILLS